MTAQTLQIILNGDPASVTAGSIGDLLEQHALQTPRVAVIQNGDIVPRAEFPTRRIAEGDVLDIITIIGGG